MLHRLLAIFIVTIAMPSPGTLCGQAAKPVVPPRTKLPESADYQKKLRAYLATLTVCEGSWIPQLQGRKAISGIGRRLRNARR
ncbi:MAG: hypothetical protein FJ303_04980 [Planctomycetes bacterium]|nr:hypothetical protein [Planctomycetota bacterium]